MGFTLVEMMIALVISTLLVIMLLSIFSRMSFSLREQQQIVAVQQTLAAARTAIETDAKQAGLGISQGFTIAADSPTKYRSPVVVANSSTGPDGVGFYYADTSVQAVVASVTSRSIITVDNATGFAQNDIVVLSTPTVVANPLTIYDAKVATFTACVLQISTVGATAVTFKTSAPWGSSTNVHCQLPVAGTTMMYKFVAHYWRLDTTRPTLAPLQLEATGALVSSNYIDEAYGFSDLQVATYFYDNDGTDTNDPDTDAKRDWQSGDNQTTYTAPTTVPYTLGTATTSPVPFIPLMITISLVNRTDANVEGVSSSQTPLLTDAVPAKKNNNPLGDRDSVPLPGTGVLAGNRIYRYLTFQVDMRNMGVGR
jgi:type II secretory pathway pseudopilin PulG